MASNDLSKFIPSRSKMAETAHRPEIDLQTRLSRLRLDEARRRLNKTGQKTLLPVRSSATTPPWLSETSSQPHRSPVGPGVPPSWRPVFDKKAQARSQASSMPAENLHSDLLAVHRLHSLSGLSCGNSLTQRPPSLLISCLCWMALDLAQSEDNTVLEVLDLLPTHLRQKLADVASVLAPLTAKSINSLFSSPTSNCARLAAHLRNWEDCDQDVLDDPITMVNLSYSTISASQLNQFLTINSFPYLQSLNLSHLPNTALTFSLIALLARLPTLQDLYLSNIKASDNEQMVSSLLMKLASATPRLGSLDLSHNSSWLTLGTLIKLDWEAKWLKLEQINLSGCFQEDDQSLVDRKFEKSLFPLADRPLNAHAQPISGVLSSKSIQPQIPLKRHLKIHQLLRKVVSGSGKRPWIDIILNEG